MSILIIGLLVMPLIAVLTSISCSSWTPDPSYECDSSCRSNSGFCILYCGPLEELDQAIELDPVVALKEGNATAYLYRGMSYLGMGRIQGYAEYNHRALEDFERVIELEPENWQVYSLQGQAYQELGLYQQAILLHDKTIELVPIYPPAYHFRANAYSNLGQYQQAMQDYDSALELDSRYMGVIADRAITCARPEALEYC